jgi:hypothetical protein
MNLETRNPGLFSGYFVDLSWFLGFQIFFYA